MKKVQIILATILLTGSSFVATAQNMATFSNIGNKTILFNTTQNDVRLLFQTNSELGTVSFDIERSINGEKFQTIKTVKATGTFNNKTNYELKFSKCYTTAVVVAYRVKVNYLNGSYTTTEAVSFEKSINNGVISYGMML
jgi:hypothetical protein